MKLTRSRVLAWARYWRLDMWWWGVLALLAIGVRECSRNEALPSVGPVEVAVKP
ncbi:hypothetical protein [Hymenobacter sp. PAMC 26628]|uniref:hypothetical protein n=1 Tax=Hymenobacter sp. PAMC 26628 TaxID=1484118 RepID=UPI0012FF8F65|nr:hypothetical protein [Hymenobacter sp. PAMC 26628]